MIGERKKLPAYGARLLESMRSGALPLCVHLVYGFDWKAETRCIWHDTLPGPHPVLAVKPTDYMPGTLDWSLVTGLKVCVFDQTAALGDPLRRDVEAAPAAVKALFVLLGELGAFAGELAVYSPSFGDGVKEFEAPFLACWQTRWQPGVFPFWWPAQIEEVNAKRRTTWFRAFCDACGHQLEAA